MVKHTRLFFAIVTSFLLIPGNMLTADQEIMIPKDQVNINSPTPVQAIVTDPNGNVTEQEYTYDPNTQVVVINNPPGQDDSSIFFPLFTLGFIWWGGHWVDHDGYYYSNNRWVHVDNNDWNNHWNNYWNNNWNKNHWHNYWNNHKQNPNFRYRNQERWDDSSFQRGRGAGVRNGDGRRGGAGPRGGGRGGR